MPDQDEFVYRFSEGTREMKDFLGGKGSGLKLGICGEHGGDPKGIEFFHEVGLDYVACSP